MERTGIELEEAVELITAQIHRITDTETVSLPEAAGRVLAEDCYSEMDNPPFDRSPLDGYAF